MHSIVKSTNHFFKPTTDNKSGDSVSWLYKMLHYIICLQWREVMSSSCQTIKESAILPII